MQHVPLEAAHIIYVFRVFFILIIFVRDYLDVLYIFVISSMVCFLIYGMIWFNLLCQIKPCKVIKTLCHVVKWQISSTWNDQNIWISTECIGRCRKSDFNTSVLINYHVKWVWKCIIIAKLHGHLLSYAWTDPW